MKNIKELEVAKKALELACSYNLSNSCPVEELGYTPSTKCSGDMCSESECIACWCDYFINMAKRSNGK